MGTHPIFESDFDCLTETHGHRQKNKIVNKFTQKRNEQRPNKYSKKAQEKRDQQVESKKADKIKKEEDKKKLIEEKQNERKDRDRIMNLKTKKGQPVLHARIGLYLKDLESNPGLYKL